MNILYLYAAGIALTMAFLINSLMGDDKLEPAIVFLCVSMALIWPLLWVGLLLAAAIAPDE